MNKKQKFNYVAENYDKYRIPYPLSLVDFLVDN